MDLTTFERFQELVLDAGGAPLRARLAACEDWDEFVSVAVELARECGLDVTASDLEGARDRNRRAWLERWIG